MSFQSDLAYGEEKELLVLERLLPKYPKAYKVEGYHKEWDIFIPEKDIGVEVKSDRMSKTTGNVAIEYSYGGEPSGIEATKAEWWVYITEDTLYWIKTKKIKECIKENELKPIEFAPIKGDYRGKFLYLIKETLFKDYITIAEKLNGRN
jgi:hypothetical protein